MCKGVRGNEYLKVDLIRENVRKNEVAQELLKPGGYSQKFAFVKKCTRSREHHLVL